MTLTYISVADQARALAIPVTSTPPPPDGVALLIWIAIAVAVVLLLGTAIRSRRLRRSIDAVSDELRGHDASQEHGLMRAVDDPRAVMRLRECIDGAFARIHQSVSGQQRFLTDASHELRTPLAAIRAQAQVGLKSESLDESRLVMKTIMGDLDRASRLIEQLLALSRIDARMPVDAERVCSLSKVLDEVLQDLRPLAQSKQISIESCIESDDVSMAPLDLGVLVRNLLLNSIQYSPVCSRVSLRACGRDGGVLLTVDDSGPGIPDDRTLDAFAPFNRLGKRDGEGVGLGLSLVKRVVDSHNATILLQRSRLGGLRVEVWFPR